MDFDFLFDICGCCKGSQKRSQIKGKILVKENPENSKKYGKLRNR
jgi:hypothetical protein